MATLQNHIRSQNTNVFKYYNMKLLIVLCSLAATILAFTRTATLDSISAFGTDINRIYSKLLYETSCIDELFEEDYYIFLTYRQTEDKKRGFAIGDFKASAKIFQFEITDGKIKYWSVNNAPLLNHYEKLIDSYEKSILDITSYFRCGFYIDFEFMSTDWNFLSFTRKNGELLKRYGFLSYERNYPSSILIENYPNTVEKLMFYGIILATQPISDINTKKVVIEFLDNGTNEQVK